MPLSYTSELCWFLSSLQEQVKGDAGETNTAESKKSSCDEAVVSCSEPRHLPDTSSLALRDVDPSDEDSSEYEDCPEEEEEVWQTCSEEDSNPDEEACGLDWQGSCPVDSEAQGRKTLQKECTHNFTHLVSRQELLEIFKQLHTGKKVKDGQLTIGLVK